MRNVRVTALGVGLLAVLAAAVVLAIWGSGPLKDIGVALIGVILLMLVGEGMSGGIGPINADAARKQEVLSRGARKRRFDDAP